MANNNSHFSSLISHFQRGFTLVELLVVIALTGIMVAIGTNIFISILRSSTKATTINQVRENGNVVVETMSRYMQNASEIVNPATDTACSPYVIIKNRAQGNSNNAISQKMYTQFYIKTYPNNDPQKRDGFIAMDSKDTVTELQALDPDTQLTPITNKSGIASIDVSPTATACFRVIRKANEGVTIIIPSFTLTQSKKAPPQRKELEASIEFQTSYTIRSY